MQTTGVHRKRFLRSTLSRAALPLLIMLYCAPAAAAQEAPLLYLLSDGEAVHIILENTPPQTAGFEAYRRGPGEDEYRPLTLEAVRAVTDPYRAYELLGADARWLARRFDTADPVRLWRKMEVKRSMAYAYALVSPGLRMALGRTLIDRSVEPGERYRYRIVLIDRAGQEIETVDRRVTVEAAAPPEEPGGAEARKSGNQVLVSWEYPRYRGGRRDRTAAFHIYRRSADGQTVRINRAPVLRIEGHLQYLDTGAREGETYRYGVAAVDIIGQRSAAVFSEPLTMEDTKPPLVPMGLQALDREEGVLLLWNLSPEADVAHYNLYRSDSLEGDYEKINGEPVPVDTTRFFDAGVTRGRAWYYTMTAVDEAGNESPRCGPQTIIPVDRVPPAEVEGLGAEVDEEKRAVTLSWEPSPEKDLEGYFLYRRLGEGSYTRITHTPISPSSSPRYRDTGVGRRPLRPGGQYHYAVSAADHSGNEGPRTEIAVEIPDLVPPREVFSFSARPTRSGAVQLRWQPSLARDMDSHRIYRRREEDSGEAQLILELAAEETSAIDDEVSRGVAYLYRIVEVDRAGNASEPSPEERVVPLDMKPPAAPRELQARRSGGDLLLSWRPPEDGDVAGYRVYRAPYPKAGERELTEEPVRETEYSRRGAAGDVGAVYTVTAVDTSGNEGEEARLRLEEGQ